MSDELTTMEDLESRIGKASALVHVKTIDHLDGGALDWVRSAPLMFCGLGGAGGVAVTLGGGRPGWADGDRGTLVLAVPMIDEPHLAEPDASFGSVFMIPSIRETLRINGRVVAKDGDAIRVRVEECYLHCGKALIRSDFWQAQPRVVSESVDDLAGDCRFLALATVDARGRADLSPKGDPAGALVHLRDDALLFADRPGNRRIDSFRNILTQPRVAAALVVPGATRLLKASGRARISDAEDARARFAVQDKAPALVTAIGDLRIEVRDSAALARAGLWPAPAAPAGLSAADIGAAHLKLGKGLAASLAGAVMSVPGLMRKGLELDYRKNLY